MNHLQQIDDQIGKQFKESSLLVRAAFPSIFSKDDVIDVLFKFHLECIDIAKRVLDGVDLNVKPVISREALDDLQESLRTSIANKLDRIDSEDVVDFDSAEMRIDYNNTVELDCINVNTDYILDKISDAISDVVNETFLIDEPQTAQ